MEKRYLIKEQGECDPGIVLTGTITETELKKRLSAIVLSQQGWGPPDTWDEAIDVLLHGTERDQPPQPEADYQKALLTIASYDSGNGCCQFGCDCPTIAKEALKIGPVTEKEQPNTDYFGYPIPKQAEPTRKEWEEWVENMPSHSMSTRMEWEEKMKDWFLTMPGVPKE